MLPAQPSTPFGGVEGTQWRHHTARFCGITHICGVISLGSLSWMDKEDVTRDYLSGIRRKAHNCRNMDGSVDRCAEQHQSEPGKALLMFPLICRGQNKAKLGKSQT